MLAQEEMGNCVEAGNGDVVLEICKKLDGLCFRVGSAINARAVLYRDNGKFPGLLLGH